MSVEDSKQSMFDLKWQRLEQLTYSEDGVNLLEDLMGEDVELRKDFVFNEIDFTKYGEV